MRGGPAPASRRGRPQILGFQSHACAMPIQSRKRARAAPAACVAAFGQDSAAWASEQHRRAFGTQEAWREKASRRARMRRPRNAPRVQRRRHLLSTLYPCPSARGWRRSARGAAARGAQLEAHISPGKASIGAPWRVCCRAVGFFTHRALQRRFSMGSARRPRSAIAAAAARPCCSAGAQSAETGPNGAPSMNIDDCH